MERRLLPASARVSWAVSHALATLPLLRAPALAIAVFLLVALLAVPFRGGLQALIFSAWATAGFQLIVSGLRLLERRGHRPLTQGDLRAAMPVQFWEPHGRDGPYWGAPPYFKEALPDLPQVRQALAECAARQRWVSVRELWAILGPAVSRQRRAQPRLGYGDQTGALPTSADWETLLPGEWKAIHAARQLEAVLPAARPTSARRL